MCVLVRKMSFAPVRTTPIWVEFNRHAGSHLNSPEMMDVPTDDSLNQSMNKAKRHYSSLFTLPSFPTALAAVAALCLVVGATTYTLFPTPQGLINGLLFGVGLFLFNLFSDLVLSQAVLKKDPIFNLRRTLGLSLFSWVFWLAFILLGLVLGVAFGFVWWVRLCLLGYAVLLNLRTVVFFAVLSESLPKRVASVILQPLACILPFAAFWILQNVAPLDYVPFIVIAPIIGGAFALFFLKQLDRMGKEASGKSAIVLFKAFMLNWVAALNGPLESYFEELGQDADVEVSVFKFASAKHKTAFIVPLVHPGPFKNIGSSLLPSMMKEEYEKSFHGDACVPLGLLGHELDAASQAQNHKIIDATLKAAQTPESAATATPYMKVSEGFITVSCQVFGKIAFLSFTLAPKTTEDLPQELGSIVRSEAQKRGFENAIVVNAHNSLTQSTEIEATVDQLRAVAAKCLEQAAQQASHPFEVGSATVHPAEFTLKDGLATGGITAIAVKVGAQKTAYIVIDGNNMVSGLREKIQTALTSAGFQESEVFTTDTHAVSAVVVGPRGYHPVGEAMNHAALINYITQAAQSAASKLEPSKAAAFSFTVPKVRVIGGDCIENLSLLVDKVLQRAKHIIAPIFAAEGVVLVVLLLLL
jgi:putative membrane protein